MKQFATGFPMTMALKKFIFDIIKLGIVSF